MKRTLGHHYLRVLSVGLASLLVVDTVVAGQSGAGIVIQILEANAGQNMVAQELPPTKVRVMDRSGRVLSGASVLFLAPEEGATGHFLPNLSQVTVTTDPEGMAAAPRFRTNSTPGDYQIQVVASYRDSASRVLIPQSNVLKKKSSSKKYVILSAVIGGAAAAAFAFRGNDSGPASSALSALAATPTINLGDSSLGVSPSNLGGAPAVGTTSALTIPSTDATSSTGVSPTVGVVQPPTIQTQPPVSSVCAKLPPTAKRPDCR